MRLRVVLGAANYFRMSIKDENYSSQELIRDCLYHRAACTAHPQAQSLAIGAKVVETALKAALATADQKEEIRIEKQALLDLSRFELLEQLRAVDLEVLLAADRKRANVSYRVVFPKGISVFSRLTGTDAARAARTVVTALEDHHPTLAKKYKKPLETLATALDTAAAALADALAAAEDAFAKEILSRAELVKKLRQNEGALMIVFPGNKPRVRAFFRAARKSSRKAAKNKPLVPSGKVTQPVPAPQPVA